MSRAEKAAAKVRRAAEREHAGASTHEDRRKSDSDAAGAHPTLTDPALRKGHPPIDEERDKAVKHGGMEEAKERGRGRP